MITFKIDEITPCLKENATGEIYETEVVRIKRKSVLKKYNQKSGWHVNWASFSEETEIYALVLEGTYDIQGMLAIQEDEEAQAIYIAWACTAPHNNIWEYGTQKFSGVGGHLLALASDISVKRGYDGFVYGEAIDEELFDYYCAEFNASYLPPINNPYRFMLSDAATKHLREVYNYGWTDDVI
jgi:hypothetical protein